MRFCFFRILKYGAGGVFPVTAIFLFQILKYWATMFSQFSEYSSIALRTFLFDALLFALEFCFCGADLFFRETDVRRHWLPP